MAVTRSLKQYTYKYNSVYNLLGFCNWLLIGKYMIVLYETMIVSKWYKI
jgi:hypothetical protein